MTIFGNFLQSNGNFPEGQITIYTKDTHHAADSVVWQQTDVVKHTFYENFFKCWRGVKFHAKAGCCVPEDRETVDRFKNTSLEEIIF